MTDAPGVPLRWVSRAPPPGVAPREYDAVFLIRDVARRHGLSPADVTGRSRQASVIAARREIARRLYYDAGLSLSRVGRLLGGRHHTTVLSLLRRR